MLQLIRRWWADPLVERPIGVATATSRDELSARAAEIAATCSPKELERLRWRLHAPPDPAPPGWSVDEAGLGTWMMAWQTAIFEVWFAAGAPMVPTLRAIGFGAYDWIQASAVTTLLRLAARDVDRARTVTDVRREFPRFRFEAQLYVVQDLLTLAPVDPTLAAVIAELSDLAEWRAAEEEL
jgi:hypothetical protein